MTSSAWRRRVANILGGTYLLLFAAVLVLWARSYVVGDMLTLTHFVSDGWQSGHEVCSGRTTRLRSQRGELGVIDVRRWREPRRWHAHEMGTRVSWWVADDVDEYPPDLARFARGGLGFWCGTKHLNVHSAAGRISVTVIGVPYWFTAATSAVAPFFWIARRARLRRRRNSGRCLNCGYDLRASPLRCPECGTLSGHGQIARASPTDPLASHPLVSAE